MKNNKKFILFLVVVLTLTVFSSCKKDEKKEYSHKITYWVEAILSHQYLNYSDIPRVEKIMDKFDCEIEFMHPVAGQSFEKFNILIAMGKLPDIIEYNWTKHYSGGAQKALSDGLIREINLEKDAPNLSAYIKEHPAVDKLIKSEDGKYYGYHFIRDDESLQVSAGLIVREDWLKDSGMAYPETIDEWEQMLTLFKSKYGAKAPLSVTPSAFDAGCFVGAFGIGNDFYLDNGKVKYGPAEDEYKDFLALMNKWYTEGLLDSDYVALDGNTLQSNILNGVCGATFGSCGSGLGNWMSAAPDEKYSLVGVKYPVINKGDKPMLGQYQFAVTGTCAVITRDSADPQLCSKILDYGYSHEGRMLYNFGIEGVSYNMKDGYPEYTDIITNNPDGLSMRAAMEPYALSYHEGPFIQDKRYMEQYAALPQQKIALENWTYTDSKNHYMPMFSLNHEQRNEIAPLLESIGSYEAEMQAKFIMGIEPLDKFDDYRAELFDRGLEKYLSYQQEAYENYIKR